VLTAAPARPAPNPQQVEHAVSVAERNRSRGALASRGWSWEGSVGLARVAGLRGTG